MRENCALVIASNSLLVNCLFSTSCSLFAMSKLTWQEKFSHSLYDEHRSTKNVCEINSCNMKVRAYERFCAG